ncbi:MAG: dihydroxyacetone kinase subunit DhaK [Oscillospiraceae bacterium]|nr:dihydroxyacetone kinase subunit DhaK [Oscillospiraceae bacterium]
MKKIMNDPENYTNDMLRGIYAAHKDAVRYVNDDLRCYCTAKKKPGKVAIVTGGGTGHLPLFLGYVGDGMLDGCAVGSVFQSPGAEQILEISKEADNGAGILYLYGNYSGDIMNFEMAAELCELEEIKTMSLVGADDVCSAPKGREEIRRGVAGIFYLYKCAGAMADQMGSLAEVYEIAKEAGSRVRTAGFALSPCIIPEVGKANFALEENEIAMGMGIHGEPGIWNGALKTAKELADEMLGYILGDMPVNCGEEVSVLINGLGSTPLDELYILFAEVETALKEKGIIIDSVFIGEYATSMEMAGASVSVFYLNDKLKQLLHAPAHTPFFSF